VSDGGAFTGLFVPDHVADATSERAWLQAMLDVEAALAAAEAEVGIVPPSAAEAIAAACDPARFDLAALVREARDTGSPVVPLVRALAAQLPPGAASYVHWGATSQDVMDTALVLQMREGLRNIRDDLLAILDGLMALAAAHRSTPGGRAHGDGAGR
jgi:3-carboxy-cis,cis-muconate cycloisomerase